MRPAPFWSWNDKLDEAELRRQIREMAAKGWGSYFMHARVGLVTGYLSEEWMSLVEACVDEAVKTGTYAWLYDEDKWPSGYAGGAVPEKDEAYRSRELVLIKKGAAAEYDTVLASVSQGGVDYDICRRISSLGKSNFNGACYVDLMNPEAVREFINCTHERYKKVCGNHFGKVIPGIFTDEPCYLLPSDHAVVPWSDYLPAFFRELKGYAITDKLHLLFFEMEDYRKVRFDFYDAVTELFKRNFTQQYYDWCRNNNLIMTGHFMNEDTLVGQTRCVGDVMTHYEFMHWPGIDKLGRTIDQVVAAKQVSSVADQLGKERAFSEMFGCTGGEASFFLRKWIGDWQAALGINFVNHHLSLYSMRGERKRDYPPNFFHQQPWWEDEKGFADYQARLCAAASEGERLVDILLLQPLTSVWCEYSPLHKNSDYSVEKTYDDPFLKLSCRLMEEKLDFHYGNENLMAQYGSVQNKALKVGRHSYSVVLIPPISNLRSSTLSLLRKFVAEGGALIFTGALPSFIDGIETGFELPGAKIAASTDELIKITSELFPDRIRVTDNFAVGCGNSAFNRSTQPGNAESIYVHSRRFGNSTRHLLVNTDHEHEVRARVEIPAGRDQNAAVLDLSDGNSYQLELKGGSFDVIFAPAGSLLALCGAEADEAEAGRPEILGSGAGFTSFSNKIPSLMIEDFDCELMEENVFLLNDFILEINRKKVYEGPVCGAWHKYFYPAAEGTPFRAAYTFYSECEVEGCFAAIEAAENLNSIFFNGASVKPLKRPGELGAFNPEKSWKDISFTKAPLPIIRKGKNNLIIEGKKINNISGIGANNRVSDWKEHRPTEAEEIYICGKFSLKRVSEGIFTMVPFEKPPGKNLTKEGFPFYCGRIALRATFDLPRPGGKTFLKLNGAAMACAVIRVNGETCGVLRWAPFALDISKFVRSGENILEVEASPTLVNAFGPNRIAGVKNRHQGVGPHSFVWMERFMEDYELFDFGVENAAVYTV